LNLGQLLPPTWGIQLPFSYSIEEEFITPQYDPEYQDIELKERLNNIEDAAERDRVEDQSITHTKRQSVNLIGVKKNRTTDKTPMPYDIENFTFSYSYNQEDHKSFEIEESIQQNVRVGATYDFAFPQKTFEPFKNN